MRFAFPAAFAAALAALATLAACTPREPRAPHPGPATEDSEARSAALVTARIRERLEAAALPAARLVAGEDLRAPDALARFYTARGYAPAWTTEAGPTAEAESLLVLVAESERDGLTPEDYHPGAARALVEAIRDAPHDPKALPRRADLDLLLSDSFLLLATHLLSGRVNPETIDPEWNSAVPGEDPAPLLSAALDTLGVAATLRDLAPPDFRYARLREALGPFRASARGRAWPALGDGDMLRAGSRDDRVPRLRARLVWTGDLPSDDAADPDLFDPALDTAVRAFQRRHGLPSDGVVGPATVAELDVPPEARVQQIEANLERWRWLPRDLGRRHIVVNIAAFELHVVEEGREVLSMRVVAGKNYRRTPVFSGTMTYLVFSPFWNIPPLLATEDVLPEARGNPASLVRKGIRVLEGWGADEREIDPLTVNWRRITPKSLRWHFRQDPGPENALGGVKFMFPNKFDVYLHDTPATDLFARMPRDFSSGCIRVEKPIDLAEYLLATDRRWTRDRIRAAMTSRAERTVRLPDPVPIHLVYWTAWADAEGRLSFGQDVYGRDAPLFEALHRPPSGS